MTSNKAKITYISQKDVNQYELLNPLIHGIYNEFQDLSKKKPEAALNTYKVKVVNRVLEPIKELLANEEVIHFLDILDIDDLPTNSDVILILNQYLKALKMFYNKYYENSPEGRYTWAIK